MTAKMDRVNVISNALPPSQVKEWPEVISYSEYQNQWQVKNVNNYRGNVENHQNMENGNDLDVVTDDVVSYNEPDKFKGDCSDIVDGGPKSSASHPSRIITTNKANSITALPTTPAEQRHTGEVSELRKALQENFKRKSYPIDQPLHDPQNVPVNAHNGTSMPNENNTCLCNNSNNTNEKTHFITDCSCDKNNRDTKERLDSKHKPTDPKCEQCRSVCRMCWCGSGGSECSSQPGSTCTSHYTTPAASPARNKLSMPEGVEEEDGRINYYPNCDPKIWLRSCEEEVLTPLHGTKTGEVPGWLRGALVRNGPGRIRVWDYQYNHLFDGSALLHRFHFADGTVTYQNKFLESRSFLRDTRAQRIVVNYFGTRAHPDPCRTILQNVASKFTLEEHFTDNAQISLYPYGDGLYTLTETPFIYRVDPETLNTHEKVDLTRHVAVLTHTAHPHVESDGTVYNIGQGVGPLGPKYHVVKFPPPAHHAKGKAKTPFEQAKIVASVNARWRLNPCYMHSFAITENYYVIIEQPMSVSVSRIIKVLLRQDALIDALQWWEKETKIHVVRRDTGQPVVTEYVTETFFFLHTINAYEDRGHIVLDIAAYRNADMLNCMFIEALKNAAYDPTYAQMFRGRPKRWVLPLSPAKDTPPGTNLVTLPNTRCRGRWAKKNVVYIMPELLADIGCEVPRIHYEQYNGRFYQYFYAICSDVDYPNPGTLVKVDVVNKTHVEWSEDNVYPSEPVFVPRPDPKHEDDGVVISALLRAKGLDDQVCCLVLDARTFTELARVEFVAPGPVPKCLHGWFVPEGTLRVHGGEGEQKGDGTNDNTR